MRSIHDASPEATGAEAPRGIHRWIALATKPRQTGPLIAAIVGLGLAIGVVDFAMGFNASLFMVYLLPVRMAVALRGRWFGVATAAASVVIWLAGDLAAGAHLSNSLVPWWNAIIALGMYLVLIWQLLGLLALQAQTGDRVRERRAALRHEIAERERPEKVRLETSERKRRSIGHDLHDGPGQHLTGTAVTGQILLENLRERGATEVGEVQKSIALIKPGIEQTRAPAKGMLLAEISPEGLPVGLPERAVATTVQFRVSCRFEGGAATHLYRKNVFTLAPSPYLSEAAVDRGVLLFEETLPSALKVCI